jgi:hypothetical protein
MLSPELKKKENNDNRAIIAFTNGCPVPFSGNSTSALRIPHSTMGSYPFLHNFLLTHPWNPKSDQFPSLSIKRVFSRLMAQAPANKSTAGKMKSGPKIVRKQTDFVSSHSPAQKNRLVAPKPWAKPDLVAPQPCAKADRNPTYRVIAVSSAFKRYLAVKKIISGARPLLGIILPSPKPKLQTLTPEPETRKNPSSRQADLSRRSTARRRDSWDTFRFFENCPIGLQRLAAKKLGRCPKSFGTPHSEFGVGLVPIFANFLLTAL